MLLPCPRTLIVYGAIKSLLSSVSHKAIRGKPAIGLERLNSSRGSGAEVTISPCGSQVIAQGDQVFLHVLHISIVAV